MNRELEWKIFGDNKADNKERTSQGKDGEIFRSIEEAYGTELHQESKD